MNTLVSARPSHKNQPPVKLECPNHPIHELFVITSVVVGLGGGDDDDVDDEDGDVAHVWVVRDHRARATGYAQRAKSIGGGCGGGDSDDYGDHMSKGVSESTSQSAMAFISWWSVAFAPCMHGLRSFLRCPDIDLSFFQRANSVAMHPSIPFPLPCFLLS